ncbi:MAG: S8 family peptidase, partial [Planctomycetota bacterium]
IVDVGFVSESLTQGIASSSLGDADPGTTRYSAQDWGNLQGSRSVSQSLSASDRADVYGFQLPVGSSVSVQLIGLNRNADLQLQSATGRVLAESRNAGRWSESLRSELGGGRYYVAVTARSWRDIQYRLVVSVTPNQPTPPPVSPPTVSPPTVSPPGNPANPITHPTPDPQVDAGPPTPLPDVPHYGNGFDWNINSVAAPEAWSAGYTGDGVTVAVIDTGVDLDHPELRWNLFVNPGEIPGNGIDDDGNGFVDDVNGYDFVSRDAVPDDLHGHGTHVSGTIAAAKNGYGATGVAPDAKILPVRVLDAQGNGSDRNVADGIRYAANMGADIINLSLGGSYSYAIRSAVRYAQAVGSLIVASAGNTSGSVPEYPARFSAQYSSMISVGAHDRNTWNASFSNRVGSSGAVQVDAPGVGIFSTTRGGGYQYLSGTSMAAPHVAGVAALVMSSAPGLSAKSVRQVLAQATSARASGSDSQGLVNAAEAIPAARGMTASGFSASTQRVTANPWYLGGTRVVRNTQTNSPPASTSPAMLLPPPQVSSHHAGQGQRDGDPDADAVDRVFADAGMIV